VTHEGGGGGNCLYEIRQQTRKSCASVRDDRGTKGQVVLTAENSRKRGNYAKKKKKNKIYHKERRGINPGKWLPRTTDLFAPSS